MINTVPNKHFLIMLIFFIVLPASAQIVEKRPGPVQPKFVGKLASGSAIERELRDQEVHQYDINLKSGEFFYASVQERGVELIIRILAPDSSELSYYHYHDRIQLSFPIVLLAHET